MSKTPDLLEYSGRSWKDCKEIIEKEVTTQKFGTNTLEYKTSLLPRKDFSLYGEFPKLDTKVLLECDKCDTVLLPCIYHAHCNNPDHEKASTSTNTATVSKQTTSKNNKPSNYIPPGTSLLKKKYQQPKNKKKSGLLPPVPPPPLFTKTSSPPTTAIAPSDGLPKLQPAAAAATAKPLSPSQPPSTIPPAPPHPSNSKCKKSKKSAKKVKEEPEKVDKAEKPAEARVSPKTVNSVISRKICSKTKEYRPCVVLLDTNSTDSNSTKSGKETTTSNNRCVPSFVNITPGPQLQPTQNVDILQPFQVAVAPISVNKPQGNVESSSSVVYMPMSPVAVVNNVQFLRLPILRVASTQPLLSTPPMVTSPIVVTIPLQSTDTPMYTSHPKPLSMATRAIRKIGSAYLLQSQRIDRQRNEIQSITNRRTITNSCSALNTFHHRPNILKNSAKNNVKVAVKRTATDKVMAESKHIRLSDVNGFILHSDVSESAEAPLHNNSVHDKVTFLNMK